MFRKMLAACTIKLKSPDSWRYMENGYALYHSSREKLIQYQEEKLVKLLWYAYEHTRYYHRVFDEIGLFYKDILQKEHYADIPILTKQIIRAEKDNLVSDEADRRGAYRNTSGGSTGEPVMFIQDKEYFSCNFGDKILYGVLNGKVPGEKEVKLWGSERDILQGTIGLKEKAINFCYNRIFLNSFLLTPERIRQYIEVINKKKPVQIWTYADSIYQLARYVNQENLKVYSPKNIVTTAGVLYEEMRHEIQKAFIGSNILNQYGSREAGMIACEIGEKRGLRIFDSSVKLEVLCEDTRMITDEGEGELLVTNLTNLSMPLIRYQIGDTGIISQNLDGYDGSYSLLKNITGRTNTHLKRKDGSLIHGEYATHLFYNKGWIENFRVIQHDYEDIEFQIVVKDGVEIIDKELEQMHDDLKRVLGECAIRETYLKEIPKLKSGKYQFVISEVD